MSTIHRFFTESIIVRRLRSLGGNIKAFQSTATVDGHIQQLNKEARERMGIIEERTFIAWFPLEQDIKEGDRLINERNVEYMVKEVTRHDFGINEHLEVIIEEANA